jgi:hypothetical protein
MLERSPILHYAAFVSFGNISTQPVYSHARRDIEQMPARTRLHVEVSNKRLLQVFLPFATAEPTSHIIFYTTD